MRRGERIAKLEQRVDDAEKGSDRLAAELVAKFLEANGIRDQLNDQALTLVSRETYEADRRTDVAERAAMRSRIDRIEQARLSTTAAVALILTVIGVCTGVVVVIISINH